MNGGFLFAVILVAPWVAFAVHYFLRRKKIWVRTAGQRHNSQEYNTNGLPMTGCVDVSGNPFGAVSLQAYNINGLPMAGGVDVSGNPFGVM